MEKGILHEVIEVEKEMLRYIESEEVKLQKWLEQVKNESEKQLTLEEEKVRKSFLNFVKNAIHDAERKASDIVREAITQSDRLEKLDTGTLTRIVMKHINRILPG